MQNDALLKLMTAEWKPPTPEEKEARRLARREKQQIALCESAEPGPHGPN